MKLFRFAVGLSALFLTVACSLNAQTTPPPPTNLTATLERNANAGPDVKLQWQLTSTVPWRFRIYRSLGDTNHYQPVATTADLVYRDYVTLPSAVGTAFHYYVVTYGTNAPTVESARSNVVDISVTPFPVARHGFISGTVTDDSTHAPLRRTQVSFFRMGNAVTVLNSVFTDSLGHYTGTLDTGRYIARATAVCASTVLCYYPQYFDHVREPSQATVITVGDSTTFTANFALARIVPPVYAALRGTVTDTLNHPLRRARVAILRTMQEMSTIGANGGTIGTAEDMILEGVGYTVGVVWSGFTDSLGNYSANLVTGRDYIAMASKDGYVPQYYDHKPTPQLADIIHFAHDTTGINFTLPVRPVPQNSIAGQVVDSLAAGVPSRVYLYPARVPVPSALPVRYVHTDSLGNYAFNNVEAGKYFVSAFPFQGYAPAYYKANACGVSRRDQADTVSLTGHLTGINICVRAVQSNGLASVSGVVRTASNATVRGTVILAESQDGVLEGVAVSDPSGAYAIESVSAGTLVLTTDRDGYAAATTTIIVPPQVFTVGSVNFTLSALGVTSVGNGKTVPAAFALGQNYPNPFNPSTVINYEIPKAALVTLKVYDVLGREVAVLLNEPSQPGSYSVTFDAKGLSSGVYYYTLKAGSVIQTRRMMVVK